MPEFRDDSHEERIEKLGLTSLEERRRRGDLIEVFKIMKGFEDIDRERFFTLKKEVHRYNTTGHDYCIHFKQPRTTMRKNYFDIRIQQDWNDLPPCVVNCQSISSFKKALDKHI